MKDTLQQQVLDTIQSNFPLEEDPYGVLAAQFGVTRDEIQDAVCSLCFSGGVRRIGASFDSRKLGYTSTLCALAVPGGEDEVLRAAEIISTFHGVTHNYGRAHRYNIWFTLITRSVEEKQAILDAIREQTGCDDLLDMPSIRKYKIAVDFGRHRAKSNGGAGGHGHGSSHASSSGHGHGHAAAHGNGAARSSQDAGAPFNADDAFDVALVRWAQDDIARDQYGDLIDDPYIAGAACLNEKLGRNDVTPAKIIARLRELKAQGTVRRFGAMVRHHVIGFAFNSMTVWNVPDEYVDQAGELFASAHFVSHCYTRHRMGSWNTNLYAMTHAQTAEELVSNIETLQTMLETSDIPYEEHFALETTAEFKKVSMRYFLPSQALSGGFTATMTSPALQEHTAQASASLAPDAGTVHDAPTACPYAV